MNKNNNLYLGLICFFLVCIVSFTPTKTVEAETIIEGGSIAEDTIWDKEHSPYVIKDFLTVPSGIRLTMKYGVVVRGDYDQNGDKYPGVYVNGGSLSIVGNRGDFVNITNLPGGISIRDGSFVMERVDISDVYSISIINSVGTISTSTLQRLERGIDTLNSRVKVWGSDIKDMKQAFLVRDFKEPIYQMYKYVLPNRGGEGNVFDENENKVPLMVTNTSLENITYAVSSYSTSTVFAKNNWWGNESGPKGSTVSPDYVTGFVAYEPWLIKKPVFDPEENVCCSSILFLPGIEASNLYKKINNPVGIGTVVNTLWEPNRNADVEKLYLNKYGSSTDISVFSGAPIGKALGIFGIYNKFIKHMDSLVTSKKISEWKPYGYDWRRPIDSVVLSGEKKATTTESLIPILEDLASRSKTGKITIIAHSNGGLVLKYLINELGRIGKTHLVDKVISVAVPYLGTPQAIASILHGDRQEIGYGFILEKSVARQLGINMPSAYSLLPSEKYFERVTGPVVSFVSTSIPGLNMGAYPLNISSASTLKAFVNDERNVRNNSGVSNADIPSKGNKLLFNAATIIHGVLDPLTWPKEIVRYAVLGWNSATTKKVNYLSMNSYSASTTNMGDGTVVAESAAYNFQNVGSLDLKTISENEKTNINHARIMESDVTLSAIDSAIEGKDNEWCQNISKLSGASCGEPDYSLEHGMDGIVVSTHSPVELHVYDDKGNHTGLIKPSTETTAQIIEEGGSIDDALKYYENNIVGSKFDINLLPNNEAETKISLPDDGRKYGVEIIGIGVGAFTYDVERYERGVVSGKTEYVNIPVTPFTIASTTIHYESGGASSTVSFASSSSILNVDIDGDGGVDMNISPNMKVKKDTHTTQMQKLLKKLGITNKKTKNIFKERNEGKTGRRLIKHIRFNNITNKDRADLLVDIEENLERHI